jgi:hypothetical protein
VDDVVGEWSGGLDAVTYVVLMKARMDSMVQTIVRMKNTNDILRHELRATKQDVADMASRLRFLNAKNKKLGSK